MKALVLSSQAKNTGSTLRAYYIQKYLKKHIHTEYIEPPFKSMPLMLDFLLSLFYYFFKVLNKRYDAVIIVKPYPNTVWPALLLKMKGAKIIIDIDDLDYGYRSGMLSGLIKMFQSGLTEKADYLTSHNDELIGLIKKEHPGFSQKVFKLKQCVDLELYGESRKVTADAATIKSGFDGRKILFYTAHLNIACYLEEILGMMSGLGDGAVLIVGGGGPLLGHYIKLAAKMGLGRSVVFTGALTQQQVAAYITAADLCLVYYSDAPVNRFRASMKVREYMALNADIVANSVGELSGFGEYVYLSGSSFGEFSEEVRKRIKTLDKRGKKGYKFIKSNYDWSVEILDLSALLKRLSGE
jgi:glycosyltransferase involved in cell wall biosynthesis